MIAGDRSKGATQDVLGHSNREAGRDDSAKC